MFVSLEGTRLENQARHFLYTGLSNWSFLHTRTWLTYEDDSIRTRISIKIELKINQTYSPDLKNTEQEA